MKRFQSWSGMSFAIIIAVAIAAGCTRTLSVVPTAPISVFTPTSTATNTSAPTSSPTPQNVTISVGSSSPANSTDLPGTLTTVLEITAANSGTSSATLSSVTLTASGSGPDNTGIFSVALYADTNNDGVEDAGDTLLTSGTYSSDNGTLTLNFSSVIPASSSVNYFVVDTFSPTAPAGTYIVSVAANTDVTGSSIVVTGAPISGAVITIANATPTVTNTPIFTNTFTSTSTITNTPPPGATSTFTPTKTLTPTSTSSFTNTLTNTITNTPPPGATSTFTLTSTSTPSSTPTLCSSVNFQAAYNFDSNSIDCWQLNSGTSIVTALGISATTTHSGSAGALQISINNTSGTISTAQIELDYTVPQNFNGAAITFYVNADAGLLDLSGYSTGIAVEDQNTGNTGYEANYTGLGGNSGTWIQIIRNSGIVNGTVIQLGIQLYNIPAGASGNLYVDDVNIALAGPTATPTITNTPPPGATATFTPTPTATSGRCPLPLSTDYTFDSTIGCWTTVDNFATSTVQWTGAPPAGSISGGGAIQANVTYPVGQNNEDFEVPLPANTDLTNKLITFNLYVDSAFGGTYGGIQIYIKTTTNLYFCNGPSGDWTNIAGFSGWHTYSMNVSSLCPVNTSDVQAMGVQVFVGGVTTPAPGHIYIDDVTVTTYVAPTATPTPAAGRVWDYEDATTQNWGPAAGSPGTPSVAVTNITTLNSGASGTNGSTYGLDIIFPAVALMDYSNNDFQVECNSGPIIGSGMDWNALNINSVIVQYCWPSSDLGTIYPYVRASGTPHGGTYGGWADQCNGTCPYASSNTWVTVTLTPSAGAWATEKSNVTAVGVDINLITQSPFAAFPGGDLVIDNITLQ